MPRRVVPIWRLPSRASPAWSRSLWYGMIRWALAEMRRPLMSIPRRDSSPASSVSTCGSTTTPFPIAQILPG